LRLCVRSEIMAKKRTQPSPLRSAQKLIFMTCAKPRPSKYWSEWYRREVYDGSGETEIAFSTPRGLRMFRCCGEGRNERWSVLKKVKS
jgi:hypothetical protein